MSVNVRDIGLSARRALRVPGLRWAPRGVTAALPVGAGDVFSFARTRSRSTSTTAVRRPPTPPQLDQNIGDSTIPIAPTAIRMSPTVWTLSRKSRRAPQPRAPPRRPQPRRRAARSV